MAMEEPPLKIKSIFSAPLNFFGILKAPLKLKKQSETTFGMGWDGPMAYTLDTH